MPSIIIIHIIIVIITMTTITTEDIITTIRLFFPIWDRFKAVAVAEVEVEVEVALIRRWLPCRQSRPRNMCHPQPHTPMRSGSSTPH